MSDVVLKLKPAIHDRSACNPCQARLLAWSPAQLHCKENPDIETPGPCQEFPALAQLVGRQPWSKCVASSLNSL